MSGLPGPPLNPYTGQPWDPAKEAYPGGPPTQIVIEMHERHQREGELGGPDLLHLARERTRRHLLLLR